MFILTCTLVTSLMFPHMVHMDKVTRLESAMRKTMTEPWRRNADTWNRNVVPIKRSLSPQRKTSPDPWKMEEPNAKNPWATGYNALGYAWGQRGFLGGGDLAGNIEFLGGYLGDKIK